MRLPPPEQYAGWRNRFEVSSVLDPELVRFVTEVAAATTATSSIPASLSPTGRWDAASIADAVQDLWADKLLTGALQSAFDRARTPGAFSAYLETSLRNMLIDRARQSGAPRLRDRLRQLLRGKSFRCFTPGAGEEFWGLSAPGWGELGPYEGSDVELLGLLHGIGGVEMLPLSRGERADAVVSNGELERLLSELFERVQAWLSEETLAVAFRNRFVCFFPAAETTADAGLEVPESQEGIPEAIESEEIAAGVLVQLTDRQLGIVVSRLEGELTLEELGRRYGCSRGTADNEFKRAVSVIRDVVPPEKLSATWKKIVELSS